MRRSRVAGVLATGVLATALLGSPGPARALPDQASDVGQANAHTHGPDGTDLDPRGRVEAATYSVDTPAPWSSADYDGKVFTTDQLDRYAGMPQVHAVYVYPKDRASRFTQFAAMFQADARQASELLAGNYGRAVRFDERLGDNATPYLDITVVQSQYSYRQLSGSKQFSLVSNELTSRFPGTSKKYVAWLDAGSRYCGQAHLYQDVQRTSANASENNRTNAIVYRPYSTNDGSGGFCRGRTLLHEVGHNLGAVQKVAPHAFDGAHCNDDDNDVMCYTAQSTFDSGGLGKFDYGNDDYWDGAANAHGTTSGTLAWWAVNLSKFVCPPAPSSPVPDCAQPNPPPGS